MATFAAAGLAGASPQAYGPHPSPKLDLVLARAASHGTEFQRVIIRAKPGSLSSIRSKVAASGLRIGREHASIDAFVADVPADSLASLAADPNIVSLSSDAIVTATGTWGSGGWSQWFDTQDGLVRETLGLGPNSPTGLGVGVAVIDSGISPGFDFAGRLVGFFDLTGGAFRYATPYDDYGHGTHVAGLIAGNGGLLGGGEHRGVAPGVRLTIFKVLDASGQGRTSDVVRAIEYVVENRHLLGVDVINLSVGHPIFEPAASDPLVQAIEQATRAGLVVVAAAGNCGVNPITGEPGYAGITSPGNAPSAITVGALMTQGTSVRSDDAVAPFSSRGPTWHDAYAKPDIVAPGDRLVSIGVPGSTLYEQYPTLRVAGPYGRHYLKLTGTSMATAVTSGVVALAIEANRRREWGR
jgi:serine protease AprX